MRGSRAARGNMASVNIVSEAAIGLWRLQNFFSTFDRINAAHRVA